MATGFEQPADPEKKILVVQKVKRVLNKIKNKTHYLAGDTTSLMWCFVKMGSVFKIYGYRRP